MNLLHSFFASMIIYVSKIVFPWSVLLIPSLIKFMIINYFNELIEYYLHMFILPNCVVKASS